jgi:hypothetical protein
VLLMRLRAHGSDAGQAGRTAISTYDPCVDKILGWLFATAVAGVLLFVIAFCVTGDVAVLVEDYGWVLLVFLAAPALVLFAPFRD